MSAPALSGTPRRRRLWLVLALLALGLLLALRVALPELLRWVALSESERVLAGRLELADVDLALLRGEIALEGLTIHAPAEEPPAGAATPAAGEAEPAAAAREGDARGADAEGAGAAAPGDAPVRIARLAVRIDWLALFGRELRLRAVEIDAPELRVERLPGGAIDLAKLLRAPAGPPERGEEEKAGEGARAGGAQAGTPRAEGAAEPAPAGETTAEAGGEGEAAEAPPAGWTVAADRVVLRDGVLRLRDSALAEPQALEVELGGIELERVSLEPGTYEEPTRLRLDARVEDGTLSLDATASTLDARAAIEAKLEAKALPIGRARLYLPQSGWAALRGKLSASLRYARDAASRDALSGSAELRELTVEVPRLDAPALRVGRFAVALDALDLRARDARVASLDLEDAALAIDLAQPRLLPLLRGLALPEAEAEAEPGEPFRWSVAQLRVADSRLRLATGAEPLTIGVRASLGPLASAGERAAPLELALQEGEASVTARGELRIDPPGFEGEVEWQALDLARLLAAVPAQPARWIGLGRSGGRLAVVTTATPRGPELVLRGRAQLGPFWLAGDNSKEFSAHWTELALEIEEARVPLPGGEAPPAPIAVRLARLELVDPDLLLTRTPSGFVMPAGGGTAGEPAVPGAAQVEGGAAAPDAAAPAPQAAPAPAGATEAGPPPRIEIAAVTIRDGRVSLMDRTVRPFFWGEISDIDLEALGAAWPPAEAAKVEATAVGPEGGKITLSGRYAPDGGALVLEGDQLALLVFNPYATVSGYSISKGTLSLRSDARLDGTKLNAQNAITLHDLRVAGEEGESLFRDEFGVPLTLALALLRDVKGDISIDLPVRVDERGTSFGVIGAALRTALRGAIVSALTAPLKLVGAVVTSGGKIEKLAPEPVAFLAGRAELAPQGAQQVDALARLLAQRPALRARLVAEPSAADARWLAEQDFRAELESAGLLGALAHLGDVGERREIARVLAARRDGAAAPELSPGAAALLDRALAERPLAPERLAELARARAARVRDILAERHGLEERRAGLVIRNGEPKPAQPPALGVDFRADDAG